MTLRTRVLLGAAVVVAGLLALTHFGTRPTVEPTVEPTPTQSASPGVATGPDGGAQALVLKALEAEQVAFVDNGGTHYPAAAGAELEELRRADSSVPWGRDVFVVVPAREGENSFVVVVRAASSTGRVFCAAEVSTPQDAGTWYASTTGGPCPRVARGMPGWSTDRTAGWI